MTKDLSQDLQAFNPSPSIDDSRFNSMQGSQPRRYFDEQNMIEYDLQSDPNLTLQEKIFC